MTYSGLLLAGGFSRRMGCDKAELAFEGRPLWRRQLDLLRAAGATELLVSARPEQGWVPAEAVRIEDAVDGAGPLAGLVPALRHMRGTHLLAVAVDLPRLRPAWFAALGAQAEAGVGVAVQTERGFEPLAAIYPREALATCMAALTRGRFGLQECLRELVAEGRMRATGIPQGQLDGIENWNTPGDVASR